MEWLVIAVITAAIVVIGAVVIFTQFSRRKKSNKAPFKKTYATNPVEKTVLDTKSSPLETDISQSDSQPSHVSEGEILAKREVAQESIEKPSASLQTSPSMSEVVEAKSTPIQVTPPSMTTESPQVSETVAKISDETTETKTKAAQTAAEITEVKTESIEAKTDVVSEKFSTRFITEIESEPSPAKAETKTKDEEIEEPATLSKRNQDDQIAELLDFGTLNDWVTIAKGPLSPENFQIVYNKIVKLTYPRRKESKMREIFISHANKYVDSYKINSPVDSITENIYKSLAIVLQEDKKYEEALGLCRKAIRLGLDDGTKTGYPGRMERLKKAQNSKKK